MYEQLRGHADADMVATGQRTAIVTLLLAVSAALLTTAGIRAPVLLLAIPLMLVFWVSIGLRASFFVPSELPASWAFRSSAPAGTHAFALGTRAAMVGFIAPAAVAAAIAAGWAVGGWSAAAGHSAFVLLLTVALADLVALTIRHLPFTRAYEPGHAKLKSRWPLYLLGGNGFTGGMVNLELYAWNAPDGRAILLLSTAPSSASSSGRSAGPAGSGRSTRWRRPTKTRRASRSSISERPRRSQRERS